MKTFCLCGGDMRQRWLAELLLEKGYSVFSFGLSRCLQMPLAVPRCSRLPTADCYVLPLPVSKDGHILHAPYAGDPIELSGLLEAIPAGAAVYGGRIGTSAVRMLKDKGCQVTDYESSASFLNANSRSSAEGAILPVMERLPITLEKAKCCVVGYGHLGKELVKLLKRWGVSVTVAARKATARQAIREAGAKDIAIDSLAQCGPFDVVFNTVPAPVIGEAELIAFSADALLIELASAPGGIDRMAAQRLHTTVIDAPGIPARYAPKTAAEAILDEILRKKEATGS